MVNRSMTTSSPVPRGDVRAQIRLLGATPSLSDAPHSLLSRLVRIGHVVRIPPHWTMLAEQTSADKAYILLSGEVAVRRHGDELPRCRRGEMLGELGIVRRRLRSATVVAATDVVALHLGRDAFEQVHREDAYFRALVGEAMLRKTA
jgi:CRP/FNR family transcriptional regulator, cyclic AMP receptor protein